MCLNIKILLAIQIYSILIFSEHLIEMILKYTEICKHSSASSQYIASHTDIGLITWILLGVENRGLRLSAKIYNTGVIRHISRIQILMLNGVLAYR